MAQTAVEYLIEKLKKIDLLLFEEKITGITYFEEKEKLIIQAKEMEKEQIINFGYLQIQNIESELGDLIYKKVPEEIYNEIFNK